MWRYAKESKKRRSPLMTESEKGEVAFWFWPCLLVGLGLFLGYLIWG